MTANRGKPGVPGLDDLRRGIGFGFIAGLLEVQATYVTTGQFSWPASLAVLSYDLAAGMLLGALLGTTRLVVHDSSRADPASRGPDRVLPYLSLLFVVRCLADGIWVVWSPALEQSRVLLAQAVAFCVSGGVVLSVGARWTMRNWPPRHSASVPAIAAGVAAVLYGGLLSRSLAVGHTGRGVFALYVLSCLVFCGIALTLVRVLSRRAAWLATALVLLLPVAGRLAVGPPSLFSVTSVESLATPSPTRDGQHRPPNVILIVLDTLRADHLDLYGYSRQTSPNLSRFAARATTFTDCVSNSSWTLPGHATLFTGLHSRDHRAHGGLAESDRPGPQGGRPLAPGRLTLAEILRENGYRTEAVVSNWLYFDPIYGLDQGFDHRDGRPGYRGALTEGYFPLVLRTRSLIDALPIRWIYRPLDRFDIAQKPYRRAETINNAIVARLETRARTKNVPWFLFANYMDPHDPYLAPGEFADRFPGRLLDRPRIMRARSSRDLTREELRNHLVSQYDSEIAYLDHHLGRLLDQFEQRGMLANSLIVITSDHGEAFGEHGAFGHGRSLYREELRVPLIVYDPARESSGDVVDTAVELRSVMPWIVTRLGLPLPADVPAADIFGDAPAPQLAELYGGLAPTPRSEIDERCDRVSLRHDNLRAIHCSNGRTEVYDLAEDPRESTDLGPEASERTRRLAEEITEWISAGVKPEPIPAAELSPKEIERLRALGYVD